MTKGSRKIAFDSSVLIHHANAHKRMGPRAKKALASVALGKDRGMISVVTVTEVLSLGKKNIQSDKEFAVLQRWLVGLTNLSIVEINTTMAIEAARMRINYGFKTPDALNLACAAEAGADVFVTGDKKLLKCEEIKVKLL